MKIKKTTMTFTASDDFLVWLYDSGYPRSLSIGLFKTMYDGLRTEYVSNQIWERKQTLPPLLIEFVEFIMNDVNLYQITDIEFVGEESNEPTQKEISA